MERRDDLDGAGTLIKYIAPILVALVGVCCLIAGAGRRLGAGLCDQCSGDQGPGNRMLLIGAGLLIAAVVITIVTWINTQPSGDDDD